MGFIGRGSRREEEIAVLRVIFLGLVHLFEKLEKWRKEKK